MSNHMLKRSSKAVRVPATPILPDVRSEGEDALAQRILREAIARAQAQLPNPAAVIMGRRGGLKGGKARAARLSPAERSRIAKLAAAARWDKIRRG